jgi:CO/xanthine dehydrogenase Mo-binding subunit
MSAARRGRGNLALEFAIYELSYQLGMEALELRLRNYAEVQPQSGLPWSSKALRERYTFGAERTCRRSEGPEADQPVLHERAWGPCGTAMARSAARDQQCWLSTRPVLMGPRPRLGGPA